MLRAKEPVGQPRIRSRICIAVLLGLGMGLVQAAPASAATLDRIRQTGKVMFGYYDADTRPFSWAEGSGPPTGYSIELCNRIAEGIKADLGVAELGVEWVPVTLEDRYTAVQQGRVDLLCSPSNVTLERRKEVSFSIPIFAGGITAMIRADTARALREVLAGRPPSGPIWRGYPAQILGGRTFSVVTGTTAESWIEDRLHDFHVSATVVPVADYNAGALQLLDRSTDALFGDRSILIQAAAHSPSPDDLFVLERLFTSEPAALALARNDDDFRLAVDRSLSETYRSPEFRELYTKWIGTPDDAALAFFRQNTLPE